MGAVVEREQTRSGVPAPLIGQTCIGGGFNRKSDARPFQDRLAGWLCANGDGSDYVELNLAALRKTVRQVCEPNCRGVAPDRQTIRGRHEVYRDGGAWPARA